MKRIFIGSLFLNLISALVIVFLSRELRRVREKTAEVKSSQSAVSGTAGEPAAATNYAAPRSRPFHWDSLESKDYLTYIANLRRIGCPESTVRDIIIADVSQVYARKEMALRATLPGFEFWRAEQGGEREKLVEQLRAKLRELAADKRRVIEALLGPGSAGGLESSDAELDLDPRMDNLPTAVQRQLRSVEREFRGAVVEMLESSAYGKGNEDDPFAAIRELRKQKEASMVAILSPQEKEEYDLRASPTAEALRKQLAGFAPTEEEFRAILRLRKPIDDEFALDLNMFGGERAEQERAARQQMEDELKRLLGESRYAEYQRLNREERRP